MSKRDSGEHPLVSIIIPARNEEVTLPVTLSSIYEQTYSNIEIIVIDNNSTDKTKEIANKFGVKVISYGGKPLGARYVGLRESEGHYVLLLDADQILKKDTIERGVEEIKNCDMLILEEASYNPTTWTQKQIAKERQALHNRAMTSDIIKSGLFPRFFKREFLMKVYQKIPEKLLPIVFAHDDAIVFDEAYKISTNVKILPRAVMHIEERNLIDLIIHSYGLGKSSKALAKTGLYEHLYSTPPQLKNLKQSLTTKTTLLTLIRSMAYRIGFILG